MNLKLLYMFQLCILLLLCTACWSAEQQYSFPLSQDVVENVIDEQQLSWYVEDNNSYDENRTIYSLRNNEGVFCSVESDGVEGERFLGISLHFPQNYTVDQMKQFNEQEWPKLFNFASMLYGNSNSVKQAYYDFIDYINSKDSNKDGAIIWPKRVGDDHYRLTLYPYQSDENYYKLNTFGIMNNGAYERLITGYALGWKNSLQEDGSLPLSRRTVADIKEKESFEEDQRDMVLRFVVNGYLKDISKPKDIPESFKTAADNYLPSNKEGYLRATLVDNTGSMEVFLRPTSLNSEELKQERDHYMYFYNMNEPFFVIQLSVLGQ